MIYIVDAKNGPESVNGDYVAAGRDHESSAGAPQSKGKFVVRLRYVVDQAERVVPEHILFIFTVK